MNSQFVPHDERMTAVENESYRWAYLVQAFGILASVAYRSFAMQESSWDLLALVLLGGAVATFYQARSHVLSGRWAGVTLLTVLIAAIFGVVLVLIR